MTIYVRLAETSVYLGPHPPASDGTNSQPSRLEKTRQGSFWRRRTDPDVPPDAGSSGAQGWIQLDCCSSEWADRLQHERICGLRMQTVNQPALAELHDFRQLPLLRVLRHEPVDARFHDHRYEAARKGGKPQSRKVHRESGFAAPTSPRHKSKITRTRMSCQLVPEQVAGASSEPGYDTTPQYRNLTSSRSAREKPYAAVSPRSASDGGRSALPETGSI